VAHGWVGEEGENVHLATTRGTQKRQHLVDPSEQSGPAPLYRTKALGPLERCPDAAVLRGQHDVIALATLCVVPTRPVGERAEERRDLAPHRGHVGCLSRILLIDEQEFLTPP
jgi:hypothetical protein